MQDVQTFRMKGSLDCPHAMTKWTIWVQKYGCHTPVTLDCLHTEVKIFRVFPCCHSENFSLVESRSNDWVAILDIL